MSPYVLKEVQRHADNLIVEAAFLDPEILSGLGELVLVVVRDEQKHRNQFFEHREEDANNIETFPATRIIQDYLIEEAQRYNIKIIEN